MPRVAQRAAANVASLPAPIGGWNARDSIANMAPTDAFDLENLFPTVSNVILRGGYVKHATGLPSQVETLMSYNGATSNKLFAISDGKIYDVTTAGAVGAAAVSGLTNSRWEYINVATIGGNFMYLVNGVDAPRLYDGTTWTAITGASTPAITGVTTTSLTNIALFKNRVWFIEKNTLKAWYLPTMSVGGAAQSLDLSAIAKKGGYLVAASTWTVDAGYGMDDNLAFVTSQGEVIVYRGTDPSSAATWALVGVFTLGSPVSKRCMLKYGGDLLVITLDGLVPMASAIQSSRLDPRVNLSDKIQGAFTAATSAYKDNFGWDILFNPKNNALWVNIPVNEGNNQQQYVMNTITKSWTKFTNWNANVFELHEDDPYFGGNGYVAKAWRVGTDANSYIDDTNNIVTNCLQAFNYYGSPAVKKYFTRARPSIFTNGSPSIFIGMNIDFNTEDTTGPLSYSPSTSQSYWGTAIWDTSLWSSDLVITNNWQGITGIGYCGGLRFKSTSRNLNLEWAATDVVFQSGWAGI